MADATLISVGGYYPRLFSVATFPGFVDQNVADTPARVADINFSQNGNWLAVAYGGSGMRVHNVSDWSLVTPTDPFPTSANGLAFSPDSSRLLIATSQSPYFVIYDTSTWTRITPTDSPAISFGFDVAFSLDGNRAAHGHNDNTGQGFQVWDTSDWTLITGWQTPAWGLEPVIDIEISERSNVLVLAARNAPYICVQDLTSKTILWESTDVIDMNNNGGKTVSISPDGNTIAVANQDSPYMHLYDARTGNAASGPSGGNLPTSRATSVQYSVDSKYLALGHWSIERLSWWDVATWTKSIDDANFGDAIFAVAFNGSEEEAPPPSAVPNPIMQGMEF